MKQLELFENEQKKPSKLFEKAFDWAKEFPQLCDDNGNFQGFDVVIGNPPYIPLKKLPELNEIKNEYETFATQGDIYTLFIELGLQILKPEGRLSYIISNKWLRAAYGESLRKFLLKNTIIEKLIDFDGLKVFDQASVDTSIIQLIKQKNGNKKIEAVRLDKTFNLEKDSISKYFDHNKIELKNLTKESWNLKSEKENAIKTKIESIGKPLKDWELSIHYGIKTGFDKAFFIDKQTKEILISLDRKNAEIIEPLLRGRDVHNYYIDTIERYLINTYNGRLATKINNITGNKYRDRVDRVNVEKDYPTIYEYLKQYETELKKREDKGEHWTNHRNCAYQHLFYQDKIIYPETTGRRSEFYLDTEKYLLNKTCFMISGNNLLYLLAVLNSKTIEYFIEMEAQMIGKSAIQNSKIYIEKIPIPEIATTNKKIVKKIETLVNEILVKKHADTSADLSTQTGEIDKLVYQLYKLTENEIAIIEQ